MSIDSIIERVRAEAAQRRAPGIARPQAAADTAHRGLLGPLPAEIESLPRPLALPRYLAYHDETFLRVAFRELLGREPDESGWQTYRDRLRNGDLSKLEILAAIRFSDEGRRVNVPVPGLGRAWQLRRLFRIPVLGYVLEVANLIVRLPALAKNYERLEADLNLRFAQVHQAFRQEVIGPLAAKADKVSVAELERQTARMAFHKASQREVLELARRVEALEKREPGTDRPEA